MIISRIDCLKLIHALVMVPCTRRTGNESLKNNVKPSLSLGNVSGITAAVVRDGKFEELSK